MNLLAHRWTFHKRPSSPALGGGLLMALLVLSGTSLCYSSTGTEGAAFLDIPVGAAPAALGSAYTALAQDAYATVWNPAGLGFVPTAELAGQHLSYLGSIHYEFASLVIPIQEKQGIGAAVQYLGSGNIPATDGAGQSLGTYSDRYAAYTLAYGSRIGDSFSFGVAGKVIDAALSDAKARAYAGDAGMLFRPAGSFRAALTVVNVGSRLTFSREGDPLPMAGHAAIAYEPIQSLLLTTEGVYSRSGQWSGRFGTEWRPVDALVFRAGYRTETTKGLSALAGLTTGVGIRLFNQEVAYSWVPYGDLGDTQYFSVLVKFGPGTSVDRPSALRPRPRRYAAAHAAEDNDPEYQQLMNLLKDY